MGCAAGGLKAALVASQDLWLRFVYMFRLPDNNFGGVGTTGCW
jgi:hypothetical protein